jgi:ankyrin repeat protein
MRAASTGDIETVRQLALDGVEINGQSPNGTTALMAAVKNGQKETAFELIELGADISLADSEGLTAIEWAKKKGQAMIVQGLEQRLSDASANKDESSSDSATSR